MVSEKVVYCPATANDSAPREGVRLTFSQTDSATGTTVPLFEMLSMIVAPLDSPQPSSNRPHRLVQVVKNLTIMLG